MCHYYDMDQEYETVKDWYNGYTFGQTDIYNPWSVIQYLSDVRVNHNWLPMSCWANTSSNSVVKTLIDQAGDEEREKIEMLLGHLCGAYHSKQGGQVYFSPEGTEMVL